MGNETTNSRDCEPVTKRLDRDFVRARIPRDELLDMLASLGRGGIAVAIGLQVGGRTLTGVLGRRENMTDCLRRSVARSADAIALKDEAFAREINDFFDRMLLQVHEMREEARTVLERYDADTTIDEIENGDVMQYWLALRDDAALDLEQVRLYVEDGADPVIISNLRVAVSQVEAWWPLDAQDGAEVYYDPPTEVLK